MYVSYRWLTSMLDEPVTLEELAAILTRLGVEVEGIRDLGAGSGNIVAARILTREKHPNADKLSLCDVDAGPAIGQKRIVCGAQNMGPGDIVPLALEGAVLPGNFVIKKSKIRGEASEGMMCSGRELGLGTDHDGLLLLPPEEDAGPFGQPLHPIGGGFEAVLEVKPTPNRGDCLCALGLVREVHAGRGKGTPARLPDLLPQATTFDEGKAAGPSAIRVEIADAQACPRYLGQVIRGVKIGPSPRWLQRILEASGLRPINNVVDATNYILLECGQPLHAFDLAKLQGGNIIVRRANVGEEMATLDGQKIALLPDDILITDGAGPVALAGVMGGQDSAISDGTTDLLLECAAFAPSAIRRTSRRLGKVTDSSLRFERGVDQSALVEVLKRATRLIIGIAGGYAEGQVADAAGISKVAEPISLNLAAAAEFLGVALDRAEALRILSGLGFAVVQDADNPDQLTVTAPGWRQDISRPVDLIEELARVLGYDHIPAVAPAIRSRPFALPRTHEVARRCRTVLAGLGLREAVTSSFLSPTELAPCGFPSESPAAVVLRNPLSVDLSVMRPSLVPGLLSALLHNQNHGTGTARLFELGRVFAPAGEAKAEGPAVESNHLAAILTGPALGGGWRPLNRTVDFHDVRALLDAIAAEFLLGRKIRVVPVDGGLSSAQALAPGELLHPGKAGTILIDGKQVVGVVGELHPVVQSKVGLKSAAQVLLLDLDALAALPEGVAMAEAISSFPAVARDIAVLAPDSLAAEDIRRGIQRKGGALLGRVTLFDVYAGKGVDAGERSLAFTLEFSAVDRTLRDDEVNEAMEKVVAELGRLGARLRGPAAA